MNKFKLNKFALMNLRMKDDEGEGGDRGGSGDAGANWRDSLPEDIKASPALADVKDVGSLAKQFVDAQSFIGRSVRVPGEDAGKEDWDTFTDKVLSKSPNLMRKPQADDEEAVKSIFKSLGAPDSKDGYSLEGVNVEGISADDPRVAALRDMAEESNMTQAQFKKAATKYLQAESTRSQQQANELKESLDSLKSEWGMAYEDKTAKAIDVLKKTNAPRSLIEAAEQGKVNGETLKWAESVATALGHEGTTVSDDGKGGGKSAMTPVEAQSSINEIMKNKDHPYWNPRMPGNKEAINRMVDLQKAAHSG